MSITITNIKPTELVSTYKCDIANPFDPINEIKNQIVKPLLTPLLPSSPVAVDENGTVIDEDKITQYLIECSDDSINIQSEQKMKEIFSQALTYYDKALNVQEIYAVQAGVKNNMIMPSQRVLYLEPDVIDAAKGLLSGQMSAEIWFATMAFYSRVSSLGFYFANDIAWSEFKTWFGSEINKISSLLTPETLKLCQDLQNMRMNYLIQGLVLRDDDTQNNEPYSFARVFLFFLREYERTMRSQNAPEYVMGHMPFSFAENICPRTILLINVEKHAHAHPSQIKNEWQTTKAAMMAKPKVLGLNKIANLTALYRQTQKIKSMAANAAANAQAANYKSAMIKFRKTAPTSVDIYRYLKMIYKHTSFIQNSENAVKSKKPSYMRPSRRDPDNPDRPGLVSKVKFKPDLHIYLDCSGSISERNYQDAIKTCIKLAQKMKVNFYFTSFSHIMSETVKLHVKDRTLKEIYDEFKNTPKVGGGTDYEQIWHYINKSAKRQKEISIIISDFEYYPPNHYVKHPRFMYYSPISACNWNQITDAAKSFAKGMLSICPDIRKHILM